MSTKIIGQRRWIREILLKFEELEKHQPIACEKEPEWPDWVHNILLMLMGISHPGSKFKNVKKWKAKDLGRFLGRQFAGEHLICGQVPLSAQVIHEGIKFGDWAENTLKQKRPDFDCAKFRGEFEAQNKSWQPIFRSFIKETLASACDRPYVESAAFFEAFGKGIIIKPDELATERTLGVGDKICWTMFVMWRDIERLQSVAQLHWVFEKALKPHGITVKYKRIEKLCQRIKLKFREGSGRPKGSKNSDKSLRSLGVISRD
jgi:hypothetical protein